MNGATGRLRVVWDWSLALGDVTMDEKRVRIIEVGGATVEYEWRDDGAHVSHGLGAGGRNTVLSGFRDAQLDAVAPAGEPDHAASPYPLPFVRDLGEPDYRMSEHSWSAAGAPRAHVSINATERELEIRVDVRKSPLFFRDAGAPDPALDNESPDINSDGVQLHLWCKGWPEPLAWLAIPERDFSHARVRRISGSLEAPSVAAVARETAYGYEIRFAVPRVALCPELSIDVLVNDMSPTRERRRGQLVLSGARGDRVYLRGDRQPLERFLRVRLPR
jgi:hypothetical protein